MLAGLALATVTAGCSVHPIPDDVSPLRTEDIVRYARCELKIGVADRIQEALDEFGIGDIKPDNVLQDKEFRAICKKNPALANKLQAYGVSAIAYDFEFNITERNNLDASLGFKLPLTFIPSVPNSGLDLTASAALHRTRDAKRSFRSAENFKDLRDLDCNGFEVRNKNLLYPITGQIGLGKVVNTFIALSEAGGIKNLGEGKDQFLDDLTFTTRISGSLAPKLTLNSVPRSFRLVSATANTLDERLDVHKLKVSLTFPKLEESPSQKKGKRVQSPPLRQICAGTLGAGRLLQSPSGRESKESAEEAKRRSQINLCISAGLAREDQFGTLRFYPPDVYCRLEGWLPTAMAPAPTR